MASSSSEREGGQVDLRLYKESANLAPSEVGVSPLFLVLNQGYTHRRRWAGLDGQEFERGSSASGRAYC